MVKDGLLFDIPGLISYYRIIIQNNSLTTAKNKNITTAYGD